MNTSKVTFLLDLGTGFTKLGLSTDDIPQVVCASCVGFPSFAVGVKTTNTEPIFGIDLINFRGSIKRQDIFTEKIVDDFELFRKFLIYLFGKISISTTNQQLIITRTLEWSNETVTKIKTILFQEFNFESIYVGNNEYFAFLQHEIVSGVVFDIGYKQTRVIPYHESRPIISAIQRTPMGGQTITEYLKQLLKNQFTYILSPLFDQFAEQIKISKCEFTDDFEEALSDPIYWETISEPLAVPQFNISLKIGIERILAPEVFFLPKLMPLSTVPLDELVVQSLKDCHVSTRQTVFEHIILIGGSINIPGFISRFRQSLNKVALLNQVKLHYDPNPSFTIWKGMKRFVLEGFYEEFAQSQTKFFANL